MTIGMDPTRFQKTHSADQLAELDKFVRFMDAVSPKPSIWRAAALMTLAETDRRKAEAAVERMCQELLANTVIENYAYEITG